MKIICMGLPRSGSTLQYNIVKALLKEAGRDYLDIGYCESSISEDIFSGEDFVLLKTHYYHELMSSSDTLVLISYRSFYESYVSASEKWGEDFKTFYDKNRKILDDIGRINSPEKIAWQSYENELFEGNNIHAIRNLNNKLGLNLNELQMLKVSDSCRVDSLRKITNYTHLEKGYHYFNRIVQRTPIFIKAPLRILKVATFIRKYIPANVSDDQTLLHRDHFSKTKGAPLSKDKYDELVSDTYIREGINELVSKLGGLK
jgi:hypothetical protein